MGDLLTGRSVPLTPRKGELSLTPIPSSPVGTFLWVSIDEEPIGTLKDGKAEEVPKSGEGQS